MAFIFLNRGLYSCGFGSRALSLTNLFRDVEFVTVMFVFLTLNDDVVDRKKDATCVDIDEVHLDSSRSYKDFLLILSINTY